MSVSDIPIWSFQKSVMTGMGKRMECSAECVIRSAEFRRPMGCGPRGSAILRPRVVIGLEMTDQLL